MAWVPVVDVSHHQGAVDFREMRRRGVTAVIIRISNSTLLDRRAAEYYRGAREAGYADHEIWWYSFLNPKRASAQRAAMFAVEAIRTLVGHDRIIYMLDIESYRMEYPSPGTVTIRGKEYADWIRYYRHIFQSQMPNAYIIGYTNRAYWNGPDGPDDRALAASLEWIVPRFPVWPPRRVLQAGGVILSAWIAASSKPGPPNTWHTWAFGKQPAGPIPPVGTTYAGWQFSADYNRQGKVYGASSSDLDLNIVSSDSYTRWTNAIRNRPAPDPDPIPPPPPEAPAMREYTIQCDGYANAWHVVDNVPAPVSGVVLRALTANDVTHFANVEHEQTLNWLVRASGMQHTDLVPITG